MWKILMNLKIMSADLTFCNQVGNISPHSKITQYIKIFSGYLLISFPHYTSTTELNLFSSYFSINWKNTLNSISLHLQWKNNQINSCKKIRKFIEDGKEFSLEKRWLFDFNFQIYGVIISTIKRKKLMKIFHVFRMW